MWLGHLGKLHALSAITRSGMPHNKLTLAFTCSPISQSDVEDKLLSLTSEHKSPNEFLQTLVRSTRLKPCFIRYFRNIIHPEYHTEGLTS